MQIVWSVFLKADIPCPGEYLETNKPNFKAQDGLHHL